MYLDQLSKMVERIKTILSQGLNVASYALPIIAVIFIFTIANVIITTTVAIVAFMQLVTVYGVSKEVSLFVATLVAIAVYVYIFLQPKIRNYIKY